MEALTTTDPGEWQEQTSSAFASLVCKPVAGSFEGALSTRVLGGRMSMTQVTCSANVVSRTVPLIRRSPSNDVLMTLQLDSISRVEQHGRKAVLTPGTASIFEAGHAYQLTAPLDDQAQIVFRMSRQALLLNDAMITKLCARTLKAEDPVMRVMRQTVLSVFEEAQQADVGSLRQFEGVVFDFIGSVLSRSILGEKSHGVAEVDRFVQFIDDNLNDPDLSVPQIAAEHFVSVRTVYDAFQARGTTPARFIRGQRLKRAQMLLRSGRTVGATALETGFGSADTFIRAFRQMYGTTPKEWMRRDQSLEA